MAGTEEETGYPLFVYGTLRPGNPLWPSLKDSVVRGPFMAWAAGYRLAHSTAGNYPVLVPVTGGHVYKPEKKFVRGTLVYVKNDAAFQSIWNMEVGAGYDAETIPVTSGPDWDKPSFSIDAFAFVWNPAKYLYGDFCEPEFLADGVVLYDWNAEVIKMRNRIPGLEEVQSIPSQKTTD